MSRKLLIGGLCAFLLLGSGIASRASGVLDGAEHQVTIWGQFSEEEPAFLLIFSSKPLLGPRIRPRTLFKTADLLKCKASYDCVPVAVHGKRASAPGQFDYFFGAKQDADRPWNNGDDFRWQDWEKYSPDVWDCLTIAALAGAKHKARPPYVIHNVLVKRNGQVLYDSRAKASRPRGIPINVAFSPTPIHSKGVAYPALNLAALMAQFRNDYYELHGDPILTAAFADLGQSDFRKYVGPKAKDNCQWCSEFVAYVYRQCGLSAPAPDGGRLAWGSIKRFCLAGGRVYPAREVASWSDADKIRLIPPGSYISVVGLKALITGKASAHSLLFVGWVQEPGKPITRYAAISGNRQKRVFMDWSRPLPGSDQTRAMKPNTLADLDKRAFFGVPERLTVLPAASRDPRNATASRSR
jgi:hypothetical protein